MLYRNGLIMYDHQTESLWSHILGQGIGGQYEGTQLTFIPAQHVDWQSWKALHPNTLVISPSLYGSDPYAGYYTSGSQGVVGRPSDSYNREEGIHPKEYVIGVRLGGQAKAYPFSALSQQPVVNDQVANIPIAVWFNRAAISGTVFDRRLEDGTTLTFKPGPNPQHVVDDQTQSEWNILTGQAVAGTLQGTQLEQVPVTYAFWFGWIDYHSESSIYTGR